MIGQIMIKLINTEKIYDVTVIEHNENKITFLKK